MKTMRRVLLVVLVIPAMIVDSIIDIFVIIYAFIYAIYDQFKYEISISESMLAFFKAMINKLSMLYGKIFNFILKGEGL